MFIIREIFRLCFGQHEPVKALLDETPRQLIDQYNKEIDEAITRVESGYFYTQDDVEKLSKDW